MAFSNEYNATIYHTQGSTSLIVGSGGSVRDENITVHTSAATLPTYGLHVLETTAASVYTLPVPKLGAHVRIISLSSFVQKVKCDSTATFLGSTAEPGHVVSIAALSTKKLRRGCGFTLTGYSTSPKRWLVESFDSTGILTVSSST